MTSGANAGPVVRTAGLWAAQHHRAAHAAHMGRALLHGDFSAICAIPDVTSSKGSDVREQTAAEPSSPMPVRCRIRCADERMPLEPVATGPRTVSIR